MNWFSRLFSKPQKAESFPFHLYNTLHGKDCKCYKCQGNPDSFGFMIQNEHCQLCIKVRQLNNYFDKTNKPLVFEWCESCKEKLKAVREYQARTKVNIEPIPIVC